MSVEGIMAAVMVADRHCGHKAKVTGSLEEVTPEPKQVEILGHDINQPLHGDASCSGLNCVP